MRSVLYSRVAITAALVVALALAGGAFKWD